MTSAENGGGLRLICAHSLSTALRMRIQSLQAARTSRSDPAATAEYMSEDIALDLRPGLASIKVPVLEIAPYNAADFPKTMPMTEAQKTAYYRSLLQGIPTLEVVSIAPSRHFVMVDQPEVFAVTLSRFLAANSAGAAASPSAQKD